MSSPRVVVVDDHSLFRDGVRSRIGGEVEIVGEAGTVDEAVDALQTRVGDALTAAGDAETQVRTAMDAVTQAVRTEGEELRTAAESARAEISREDLRREDSSCHYLRPGWC